MRQGMRIALGLTVVLTACGDDGDKGTDTNNGPSSGKCGKGEYTKENGELITCDDDDADDGCIPYSDLAGYSSFAGDLSIHPGAGNTPLEKLGCFESVGTLTISGSDNLTDLTGLENLTKANGINLTSLDKLTSLEGLAIKSSTQLTLSRNDALKNIEGLPSGFTIKSLWVNGNPALTSLSGLDDAVITGTLSFENNKALSTCEIERFAAQFPNAKLTQKGNLEEDCP